MKESQKPIVSFASLFFSFLKIGAVSFGGYMALVSMIKDNLVDKKKWIGEHSIVEGLSIASMLPGPLAVNVSTYIGFLIKRYWGGLLVFLAVLLPSFLLVLLLTHLYLQNIEIDWVSDFFKGVLPVIVAIVFKVAYGMFTKTVNSSFQYILIIISISSIYFLDGLTGILSSIVICGTLYYVFHAKRHAERKKKYEVEVGLNHSVIFPVIVLVLYYVTLHLLTYDHILFDLIKTFSVMSVTLFGGGYVFIPLMQEIIVDQKAWLTNQEFIDAIAIGQITPGPILISAAFVGYKLNGVVGAMVATFSIFLPSAVLMLIISHLYQGIAENHIVKTFFIGIRTAIVGLIFYSAIIIFMSTETYVLDAFIALVAFVALYKFDINPILLIVLSGVLSTFAHSYGGI